MASTPSISSSTSWPPTRPDGCLNYHFLFGRQISGLVLVLEGEEPDLMIGREVLVDYPQSGSLALAATRVFPTDFVGPAGTGHYVTHCRVLLHIPPQFPVALVGQVQAAVDLHDYRN